MYALCSVAQARATSHTMQEHHLNPASLQLKFRRNIQTEFIDGRQCWLSMVWKISLQRRSGGASLKLLFEHQGFHQDSPFSVWNGSVCGNICLYDFKRYCIARIWMVIYCMGGTSFWASHGCHSVICVVMYELYHFIYFKIRLVNTGKRWN